MNGCVFGLSVYHEVVAGQLNRCVDHLFIFHQIISLGDAGVIGRVSDEITNDVRGLIRPIASVARREVVVERLGHQVVRETVVVDGC